MGESWGSALGIFLINEKPEYYAGFIGTGQMVDFEETEKIDYQLAMNIAKECVDLIEEILSLGEKQYERELEYLRNRLSIELRAHEAHASENDMAYDKLIDLSKNERLFLMNARKRRVKTKIENSIKKACLLVIR